MCGNNFVPVDVHAPQPSYPRPTPCAPSPLSRASHDIPLVRTPTEEPYPLFFLFKPRKTTGGYRRGAQGELGELDAQAGFGTHPPRAPAAAAVGADDTASRAGDGNAARGAGGGGGSSSSPAGGGAGSAVPPGGGAGLEEGGGGREHGGGGGQWGSAGSASGRRGCLTDVMAHEVVIGCLVRLALVVEGETAQEVLSVLEQERGRARVRERLGRGAIGPMEEVVAKVGVVGLMAMGGGSLESLAQGA